MLKRITISIFLSCAILCAGNSQQLDHVLGELLVQIERPTDLSELLKKVESFEGKSTQLKIAREVSKPLNIWSLKFDYTCIHEYRFLEKIQDTKGILIAQFNHLLHYRQTIPDDPFLALQWQYINDGNSGGVVDADIDADLAWDITTGGLTTDGDSIVVAILDDGFDFSHQDFGNNRWINHHEIPDNGIDDDNNGYTDDYLGWNIDLNSDNIIGGSHGAPIAGIIGAKGNNNHGVAGINWNVKLMIVKNNTLDLNEANVLSAYSYPLTMRQMYNNSNGAEGAFVVATNASWGVDFGQADQAPLWCAFYDSMGEAGIISCGATTNSHIDVDIEGDLPTTCPSDYLISVTNLNKTDNIIYDAGFGAASIDLGAHGADTYTIANLNTYATFSGTSGATPHVTGAIALIYSVPCPGLIEAAKSDPAGTALLIKSYILDGVDHISSLENITVTEGRLNLNNSVQLAINDCNSCPPPFSLEVDNISTNSVSLNWLTAPDSDQQNLRWRELGTIPWNTINNISNNYTLSNLSPCISFEFQMESVCSGNSSGFSESSFFSTDGCCVPPAFVEVSDVTIDGFLVSWETVTIAESYNVLITEMSSGNTFPLNEISLTTFSFSDFSSCEDYLIQVQTLCTSGLLTDFTTGTLVSTYGCGACTDFVYCPSVGGTSNYEWISNVTFNSLNNNTQSDLGYGDYTGNFTEVSTYGIYPISLTPQFLAGPYDEYFRVWIDYNQDGQFDELNELAFDPGASTDQTVSGNITIPADALPGLTRMRVSMKFVDSGDNMDLPEACFETFNFGEVEDYCINIVEGTMPDCDLPLGLDTISTELNSAQLFWTDDTDDHDDHNLRYRKLGTFDWILFSNVDPYYIIPNLEECTEYEAQVEANCSGGGVSGYTSSLVFKTDCIISIDNPQDSLLNFIFSPNPFSNNFNVSFFLSESTDLSIDLISIDGKIINLLNQENRQAGEHFESFHQLDELASGLYIARISTEKKTFLTKLIKTR